jgi:CheY-like chemotaxis protein
MGYILVVDDEPEIAELLQDILCDAGYQVRYATNALDALAIAEEQPPRVILFDIILPDVDGAAFVKRYRALPCSRAPLIALSGIARLAETAEQIGADAYLLKPFEIDDLLETVSLALDQDGAATPDR